MQGPATATGLSDSSTAWCPLGATRRSVSLNTSGKIESRSPFHSSPLVIAITGRAPR